MIAVAIAYATPAAPRPPDGTYEYRLTVGGSELGTSTVVISTTAAGIVVQERARFPQVNATASTSYDPATLAETGYAADFNLPRGSQHTAATFKRGSIGVHVPGQSVDIPADPANPLEIVADNLVGTTVMIPAILHASGARAFTLAMVSGGGKAIAANVLLQSAPPPRPAGVPVTDVSVAIDAGGLRETYWFDPASYVVDEIQIPSQAAQIILKSHTSAISAIGTPAPVPTALPTATPHFRSKEVTFTSADGTRLAGTLTIPARGPGPYPTVILVHGSGPLDRNETIGPNPVFLQLSNAFSNAGYAVLRYDKRGFGRSGGNAIAGTRPRLLEDVRAAYAFARTQPASDARHIFLLGHSEGGELVPTAAAGLSGVAGIILMAPPAIPLWQVSMEQTLESVPGAQRRLAQQAERRALDGLRHGKSAAEAWYRSSMDIDPADDIARVRCPILILQGRDDVEILPANLPRLVRAARRHNADVTARLFSGDNHLFMKITPGEPRTPFAALHQYLTVPARIDPSVLNETIVWLGRHVR